jgi:hypothetical protein
VIVFRNPYCGTQNGPIRNPYGSQDVTREVDLLRETLAQRDKIIEDIKGERNRWAHMAESLQGEKQKLLTDGRAEARRGVWAWLLGK